MKIERNKPWLAPLAGYSDLPFRLLCREYGCAVACTEMISVKGLVFGGPGTMRLLQTAPKDSPLVVQLFGADAQYFKQALEQLLSLGFSVFDLNAGCPVKKVVKTGAGAGLLLDLERLFELVETMVGQAGKGAVGVKLRSGWDSNLILQPQVFQELEKLGAAWIAVHPRTAKQGFHGHADWVFIRRVRQSVNIPVLAGGDLYSAGDAVRCLEQTGAAGVMFARGALNNPMVFRQFQSLLSGACSADQPENRDILRIKSMILRHMHFCRESDDPLRSLLKMRTMIPRHLKGFEGAKELRRQIVRCQSWDELQELIRTR